MKKIIYTFVFLLICNSVFADTVYLKNGDTVEGRIVKSDEEDVKIDVRGVEITYYTDEIDRIEKGGDSPLNVEKETDYFEVEPEMEAESLPADKKAPENFTDEQAAEYYYGEAKKLLDAYAGDGSLLGEAQMYGDEMIKIAPDYPYGYYILSRIARYSGYMVGEKYDKYTIETGALPLGEKAVELGEKVSLMHLNLAMCYSGLNRDQEAADSIEKAVQLSEDSKNRSNNLVHKGIILKRQKRFQEAEQAYLEAEKLPMSDATKKYFYDNFGSLYIKLKNYKRALVYKKKGVELEPHNAWSLHNLGVTYRRAKDYDKAIQFELKALEISDFQMARSGLAKAYRKKATALVKKRTNLKEAEELLLKAIEKKPDYVNAYKWLVRCYIKMGRRSEAAEYVDILLEMDPENEWAIRRQQELN